MISQCVASEVGDTGLEPTGEFSGATTLSATGAAESGAVGADLESLIAAWPTLPEAVKANIVAMAKAANS